MPQLFCDFFMLSCFILILIPVSFINVILHIRKPRQQPLASWVRGDVRWERVASQDLMALLMWLGSTLAAFRPHGSSSPASCSSIHGGVTGSFLREWEQGLWHCQGLNSRPHRPSLPPQTKSESSPVRRGREISPLFMGRVACFQSVAWLFLSRGAHLPSSLSLLLPAKQLGLGGASKYLDGRGSSSILFGSPFSHSVSLLGCVSWHPHWPLKSYNDNN